MDRDAFIKLAGPVLFHATLTSNLPGIAAAGLMRPAAVARAVGLNPVDLALRRDPETIVLGHGPVTLNHQRPLLAGRDKDFLTGGTLRDWALQLDERIFFWPRKAPAAFVGSLSQMGDLTLLRIDSGRIFDACADHLFLAPINTGAARRKPAARGLWIYSPVTGTVDRFRGNRVRRGLRKSSDSVSEVSLTCDLPRDDLLAMLVDPDVLSVVD
ncbi:hypothetical protein AN189_06025 [Loktanella sp. 3ANDIMAR09]|uniref:DUF7002 family protein n=1 Tax=Loktanella sp. 3ANDIMAR09 TaxID=1225657 RepID=UPI0006FE5B67|nr:hypothetical protein [Loktanella sp. 3ANDIMAR09]KQI69134.1 hypothetical protein AN189_06025 [Loktanella sp. 3ANDIMAR09]